MNKTPTLTLYVHVLALLCREVAHRPALLLTFVEIIKLVPTTIGELRRT